MCGMKTYNIKEVEYTKHLNTSTVAYYEYFLIFFTKAIDIRENYGRNI